MLDPVLRTPRSAADSNANDSISTPEFPPIGSAGDDDINDAELRSGFDAANELAKAHAEVAVQDQIDGQSPGAGLDASEAASGAAASAASVPAPMAVGSVGLKLEGEAQLANYMFDLLAAIRSPPLVLGGQRRELAKMRPRV